MTKTTRASELRPTLGKVVCDWIERNLVHAEGDYLDKPFLLEPWQKRIIYRLYEYDPVTLLRIVRRVLIVLPKGCGKTELVAAICLAELAGPVSIRDGRAQRRLSPNIPVGAASFEQADRLFFAARTMAEHGRLEPFLDIYDTEILLKDDVGRMFRVAAQAGTNDGGLPTCFAADEIHEWIGRKARVHLVIGNSLSKRAGGLELNISTPDDADPTSLLGKLVDYGERLERGEVDDPTFLYVNYGAPLHADPDDPKRLTPNLDDPEELRAALRECHPASWVDVDRVAMRWEVDRIPEHEFRRYHLAQFVRSAIKFLPAGVLERLTRKAAVPPAGEEVVLGFDGSYNNDSTALVGCTLGPRPRLFVLTVWERPERAPEDWVVPRNEVKLAVARAMRRYRVRTLACDPPGWYEEIDEWAETYGEEIVVKFETNKPSLMVPACSKFYSAAMNERFEHDGNEALLRHFANAVTKETPDGAYITKDGRHSPRKVDVAVAAVIAYDQAVSGEEDEDSVYEERGLVSIGDDDSPGRIDESGPSQRLSRDEITRRAPWVIPPE